MAFQQYPTGASPGGPGAPVQPGGYGPMPSGPQLQTWRRGYMGNAKLASWPSRLGSGAIDYIPLGVITSLIAQAGATAVAYVILIGVILVNSVYMQGTTGQSLGKRVMGTRLVTAVDSGPTTFTFVYPGVALTFGRQLAHIVDTILFYTGYFRPLWQSMYRCWADSIAHTVVLDRSTADQVTLVQRPTGARRTQGI